MARESLGLRRNPVADFDAEDDPRWIESMAEELYREVRQLRGLLARYPTSTELGPIKKQIRVIAWYVTSLDPNHEARAGLLAELHRICALLGIRPRDVSVPSEPPSLDRPNGVPYG